MQNWNTRMTYCIKMNSGVKGNEQYFESNLSCHCEGQIDA